MNIALLASYAAPYPGNFVSSVRLLNEKVKAKGGKIVFVFPQEVKERGWISQFKDEKVYFLPYAPYSFLTIKALRKIFKDEKIDVIYSHFSGWDISSRIAAPFIRNVWHCRMNVRTETVLKKLKYFIKYRIIGANRTFSIGVSPAVGKKLTAVAGRKKACTICDGIDFSRLHIRENYAEEKKRVLILGWQPQVKGFDTACDAFESGVNGLTLSVSCQQATKDYIAARFKETLPSWLETIEPTDNVASLYDNTDIFLSASITEGFSAAIAEALYSGLPCVISDIEGTDWAWEMKNVFVFKTGDANSLAAALKKCRETAMTFENAEYNRRILLEKYSLDSWAEKVMNVLGI